MIAVTFRVLVSLAVVLFLMWGLARLVRRPLGGRAAGTVAVLARQQLSRNASVAVVKVGERTLVLGVTDANVTLLVEAQLPTGETNNAAARTELPTGETNNAAALVDRDLFEPAGPVKSRQARHAAPGDEAARGPLAGSVLSPDTWTQAIEFLRDRTSRPR
jgi:flagellar protein FliO/FliZ